MKAYTYNTMNKTTAYFCGEHHEVEEPKFELFDGTVLKNSLFEISDKAIFVDGIEILRIKHTTKFKRPFIKLIKKNESGKWMSQCTEIDSITTNRKSNNMGLDVKTSEEIDIEMLQTAYIQHKYF